MTLAYLDDLGWTGPVAHQGWTVDKAFLDPQAPKGEMESREKRATLDLQDSKVMTGVLACLDGKA